MYRKLFILTSFLLVLALVSSASAALPEGWQSRDIGTIGGSSAEIDGIWFISADGADIWERWDQFHYAYVPLSGDGTIVARVLDNGTGSDTWAKGGVMIRETLEPGSKHAMMAVTGGSGDGKAFQHRPVADERSMSAHGGDQVAPPLWVKLTRAGNTFTGYYSFDGINWIEQENWSLDGGYVAQNPATIEMARDVYIGLFVTSHESGEVRTYTFDNVSVTGLPAPGSAHIILVTEDIDRDMDGLRDDHSLESFLISEGHSVDVRPEYWNVLTPDKIAELNAADLIIVSRLAWSSRYNQGNETTEWNSLTTPLLQMNAHFARNTRWKWVNSEARAPDGTSYIYARAVDPHHPIFRDVSLTALDLSVPDGPLNILQMIDPLVGTGFTAFIGTTYMGNGRLIAKPVGLDMGWIAEWDVGVEFFEGAGQYAGGKRMLFCAGTFFDPDRQEVITTVQGELNLTAKGLQMFRNAIDYLLGDVEIILVTEEIDWDLDGLRDDHSLETFLVSEGYSVDIRPDYWKVLTPDKIAELNAADLIIVSRLAWSSHYDEGNETTEWNSLTTPLLQMNAHFAQNVRWKWVNSWASETQNIFAETVDLIHPIFIDMLLSSYDPDGRPDVVQMIDPLVGTGLTTLIGGTDMGNGQLIAKSLELDMGWIAEWDVGVEFFDGAGQYAGGRRMLFCAGTQEIQYYDYDRQEVITTAQGELNLTAEGLQIFRNAIDYLLNPEFPKVIFEPGIGPIYD